MAVSITGGDVMLENARANPAIGLMCCNRSRSNTTDQSRPVGSRARTGSSDRGFDRAVPRFPTTAGAAHGWIRGQGHLAHHRTFENRSCMCRTPLGARIHSAARPRPSGRDNQKRRVMATDLRASVSLVSPRSRPRAHHGQPASTIRPRLRGLADTLSRLRARSERLSGETSSPSCRA